MRQAEATTWPKLLLITACEFVNHYVRPVCKTCKPAKLLSHLHWIRDTMIQMAYLAYLAYAAVRQTEGMFVPQFATFQPAKNERNQYLEQIGSSEW